MAVNERSYVAANGLFSFLGIIVWILIVIGAIVLLIGLGNGGQMALVFAPVGLVVMTFGVIGLALVQIGRANVHSAEINWEMLVLARKADRQQSQATPPVQIPMREETARVAAPDTSAYNSSSSHYATEDQDIKGALCTKQLRDKDGNILKAFIFEGGTATVKSGETTHKFASFLEAREFFNPE